MQSSISSKEHRMAQDPSLHHPGAFGQGQHCQRTQNKDAAARTEPRVLRKPKFSHKLDFKMARKAGEQEEKLL